MAAQQLTKEEQLKEFAKDKIGSHLRDVVYEAQYQLKLPYTLLFFTNWGMSALLICYLFFDGAVQILGATMICNYMVLKIIHHKWYQLNELLPYKIISTFLKNLVKNYKEFR